MSVNKREILDAGKALKLFGAPPLMRGESEEDYYNLWYAFEDDIKPKSLPEWIALNDLVHKYWEQLRLRRYSPALIEAAGIEALASLLRPYIDDTVITLGDRADRIARNYYAGGAEAKNEAVLFVQKCEITLDQIFALAMQMRGSGLLILDRMDNNRQNASRALRKEIERRAQVSEGAADNDLQGEK